LNISLPEYAVADTMRRYVPLKFCISTASELGDYSYQCEEGDEGRLRKDALGRFQDSRFGKTYRRNSLGNYESDDGKQVWRKDSLGRWQSSEQTCREDSLGNWQCQPK
jgi:hypothetical protein|tara:strand:+ start:1796 stop:2119 length:324 start_codon:yes stop_codon:yes gene_type:complete